jgi:hypothetical protein
VPVLDVDSVVPFLLDRGLLGPDVLIDGVTVDPIPRRNRNLRICTADGSGYFVKQADDLSPHSRETVRREGLLYERQASTGGGLSEMMPHHRLFDPSIPLIVLDLLSGYRTLGDHCRSAWPPLFPVRVWARLGQQLAAVHREPLVTRGGPLRTDGFDVAAAWEPKPSMLATLSAAGVMALRIVQESAEIGRGLTAVQESWQPQCLIHGDLRADNVMVGGQSAGLEEIRLVDWETCRLGDPAWDVACVLAVGIRLSFTPECPEGAEASFGNPTAVPLAVTQAAGRAFWREYQAASTAAGAPDGVTGPKVALLVAARLLQAVVEMTVRAPQLQELAVVYLQLAANLFADPGRASSQLLALT